MEPSAFTYAERHDDIEAIYKKLEERRDIADITEILKELHRIVNEAIRNLPSPYPSMICRPLAMSGVKSNGEILCVAS